MAVKIEFEETYPSLKDSLGPKRDFGPQPSLNPIISAPHGPNQIISVTIR